MDSLMFMFMVFFATKPTFSKINSYFTASLNCCVWACKCVCIAKETKLSYVLKHTHTYTATSPIPWWRLSSFKL